jgi:hypothetical protein
MCQGRYVPSTEWVGMIGEYDGNGLSGLPGGFNKGRSWRENDVDMHANQLGRQFSQLIHAIRPFELDLNVLVFD